MKKSLLWVEVLALSVLMVAVFSFAGCKATTAAETTAAAKTTAAATGKKIGEGIVIYAQMGGLSGGTAVLARELGAKQAESDYGCKVNYQYSEWQPDKMIAQFKEALAAKPDGISIMGHPGVDAFAPFVDEAEAAGIIVTAENTPLPTLEDKYYKNGFGYVGSDLYEGGYLVGKTIAEIGGFKKGDLVLEYGLESQPERGKSDKGAHQAMLDAGLNVKYIEISPEVDGNVTLAVPVLTAFLAENPDCKAIVTQHGGVTEILPDVMKAANKKPGEVLLGGIDLSPKTIQGIKDGYIAVTLDQQLYLQGYIPIQQIVFTKLYKLTGLHIITSRGTVNSQNFKELEPLINQGIRG
ncbi:MAG: sugar ABC transporter substrate-binding protein [Candidatus Humimicrobiaceae bacterium]